MNTSKALINSKYYQRTTKQNVPPAELVILYGFFLF